MNPISSVVPSNPARGMVIFMNNTRVSTGSVFWKITIPINIARTAATPIFTLDAEAVSLSFWNIVAKVGYASIRGGLSRKFAPDPTLNEVPALDLRPSGMADRPSSGVASFKPKGYTVIMSYEIVDNSGGMVTVRLSGKLTYAEYTEGQRKLGEIIRQQGKMRGLFLLDNYLGNEKEGDWGDISFQARYDPFIEKMAIVGDRKWEAEVLLFTGKGVRRVPIEYFEPGDLAKAKTWLAT